MDAMIARYTAMQKSVRRTVLELPDKERRSDADRLATKLTERHILIEFYDYYSIIL